MLTTKTNFHHSKLPEIGAIGRMVRGTDRFGFVRYLDNGDKWICIAYPLCDGVLPYSIGIHTAYFRRLCDGLVKRFSGFWFDAE